MTTTPTRASYSRGDIVLVIFPNSDLRTTKSRPALIVQSNNLNTGISQVIVAMITSRIARSGHPSRVILQRTSALGRNSGLLSDSVIMTDNLATVAFSEISRRIGAIDMETVDFALRHTLELP